ncbi:MAG: DUF58 domain-containing protein [Clostridia bacterium]
MSQAQVDGQNNYENRDGQPRSGETSILFEPAVKWLLIACLVVAVWYRFMPLIVVSTFLLLLSLMITFWRKKSLANIIPALELSKSRLFAGEEFMIHGTVYNDKWLPLIWLEWDFPINKGIVLGDNERETYSIRFLWLLWFQRAAWTLKGKALHRGVYDIGKTTLRSGDGFRFTEVEKRHGLNRKLYVYPRLVPVLVPGFRPSMQWGVQGRQGGFIEDPLLVNGIREYQAGDELRRLNWRVAARTGKLQTNVYQPVVIKQLLIYIDVQGFVINENKFEDIRKQQEYVTTKEESFEWFLSVIASIAVRYKEQGISIGLASNALNYVEQKMRTVLPSMNLTPFLDQLARITQRVGVGKMTVLDEILYQGKLSFPLFIFCEYITKNHYMWYQQHKQELADVRFYYKSQTVYSEKLGTRAKAMNTFLTSSGLSRKGF